MHLQVKAASVSALIYFGATFHLTGTHSTNEIGANKEFNKIYPPGDVLSFTVYRGLSLSRWTYTHYILVT